MRYWDSSAIVPLLVREQGSALVRGMLRDDDHIVTWVLTSVEIAGAIERRARQELISPSDRRALLRDFGAFAHTWDEVVDVLAVRKRSLSLLSRHALRAADALQLGAALVVADGQPDSIAFVCLDRTLADAAEREGFDVHGWPD